MKKSNKIVVIGDFDKGTVLNSGQTAKVRDYYYYLARHFGEENVEDIDTRNCERRAVSFLHSLLSACRRCSHVVILLCADGMSIKTVFPFLMITKKLFKINIYYSLIGGGIINAYDHSSVLKRYLPKLDAIYVETHMLEDFLHSRGITNTIYAPVFSKRKTLSFSDISINTDYPLALCTYSRVSKEKGISDAIDAVVEVNRRIGKKACILDIYGPPTDEYRPEFEQKLEEAKDCVRNLPLLNDSNAIDELSKHYLMLFPTYYDGEGFPIAIVECMKSGLPVIATDWHFNPELIDQEETGYVYSVNDKAKLPDLIEYFVQNPEKVIEMKKKCCEKALLFDPDVILNDLYERIEKNNQS